MNKKENKKGRHSRVLLSGIFNACRSVLSYEKQPYVEDPRLQPSGMTLYFMKSAAFTLIELLVVVLIIGILSAIALPQYQKAVIRAHAAEALAMLTNIAEGQESYYLANGEYTNNLEDLDLGPKSNKITTFAEGGRDNEYVYICWSKQSCGTMTNNTDWPNFEIVLPRSNNALRGHFVCRVAPSENKSARAEEICKAMGTKVQDGYYKIN